MDQILSESDNTKESPSIRQKKAASKAWKTIRNTKLIAAGRTSSKIDEFGTLQQFSFMNQQELIKQKHEQFI